MSEVAAFARNIDWSEDGSGSAILSRSSSYTRRISEILTFNGQITMRWDDYIQTRVAQRNRQFGSGGTLRLFDMISCDSKRNVFNVFQGNVGEIFEGTESTQMGVQYCQGRGATTAEAIARAVQVGQVIGVSSGVDQLLSGLSNTGEDVGIRFATRYVFPNGESFAERMDALRERAADGAESLIAVISPVALRGCGYPIESIKKTRLSFSIFRSPRDFLSGI